MAPDVEMRLSFPKKSPKTDDDTTTKSYRSNNNHHRSTIHHPMISETGAKFSTSNNNYYDPQYHQYHRQKSDLSINDNYSGRKQQPHHQRTATMNAINPKRTLSKSNPGKSFASTIPIGEQLYPFWEVRQAMPHSNIQINDIFWG